MEGETEVGALGARVTPGRQFCPGAKLHTRDSPEPVEPDLAQNVIWGPDDLAPFDAAQFVDALLAD